MKAYRCGQCEEFKDGTPANEGFMQYLHWGNLKRIAIDKINVYSETGGDMDLCEGCLLKALKALTVYMESKYPHSGNFQTLNKKVNKLI